MKTWLALLTRLEVVATARSSANKEGGFSLVELLIVVFIIAVVASFIVLTAPPGTPPVEREADRLTSQLDAARQHALISGTTTGLQLTEGGYAPVAMRQTDWEVMPGQAYRLRKGEIRPVSDTDAPAQPGPVFVFDALGFARDAQVELRVDREVRTIHVEADGRVRIEGGGRDAR